MGQTTPHSVLALHLVLTLCICPLLISGLDRKISPEDLKRSLERIQAESPRDFSGGPDVVTRAIECAREKCNDSTKQLIIREVLIRNQFKKFDETCNTYNEEKLLLSTLDPNFPNAFEDQPWAESYLKWQEKTLDSGKTICDPLKNLFCSSENKCACSPEKKWKIGATYTRPIINGVALTVDTCTIPQGGRCISDGYFDISKFRERPRLYHPLTSLPLQNVPITVQPEELFCERSSGACVIFDDYFMGALCLNDDLNNRLNKLKKYFNEDVKGLMSGEECNVEGHTQLYKSQGFTTEKFNARLKAIESFQASGAGVCDLRSFHTCGKSGKCECLEPTVLDGAECSLPVSQRTCGNNSAVKAMIMTNGFVPEAQRRLAKGIEKLSMGGCGVKSRCYIDIQNASGPNDVDMFCICKGFFTGEGCDEALTLFLPFTRGTSLPLDVKDSGEKLKIFSDFNKEAIKFQEKLKLKSGEKCDFYKELEIRRLIRRIDSLKERSTKMTKAEYENLISAISKFTKGGEQYCLRKFDPKRSNFDRVFLIEHSPYNQPIECDYMSRVCQTPLPATDRQHQGTISSSHKKILGTYFSTLGCGEPRTTSIEPEEGENGAKIEFNIDRAENFLYNKTTFCLQPTDAAVRIMCETEKNGVTRKCVCRSSAEERCQKACSSDSSTSPGITTGPNNTNHGVSSMAINGGVILMFVFLTQSF